MIVRTEATDKAAERERELRDKPASTRTADEARELDRLTLARTGREGAVLPRGE